MSETKLTHPAEPDLPPIVRRLVTATMRYVQAYTVEMQKREFGEFVAAKQAMVEHLAALEAGRDAALSRAGE